MEYNWNEDYLEVEGDDYRQIALDKEYQNEFFSQLNIYLFQEDNEIPYSKTWKEIFFDNKFNLEKNTLKSLEKLNKGVGIRYDYEEISHCFFLKDSNIPTLIYPYISKDGLNYNAFLGGGAISFSLNNVYNLHEVLIQNFLENKNKNVIGEVYSFFFD